MTKTRAFTGLAGAAAMAGASQAYGAVVVVPNPANIVGHAPASSDSGTRVNIDLNGDGTRDVSILYRNLTEPGGTLLLAYIYAGVGGTAPGSVVGTSISGQAYAYNLATGTTVGPASSFYQKSGYFGHLVTTYAGNTYGVGNTTGTRLNIGFEFRSTVSTTAPFDFGYITLEVDPYVSAANPGGIQFFKVSYDNTPGTAITITNAVPEPTSLAALAFGAVAAGGVALRKRRQRAATQA